MKIIDLLKPNSIALNYAPGSKEQLYDKLISLHDGAGTISDKKQFKADILKREEAYGYRRRGSDTARQERSRKETRSRGGNRSRRDRP